MNWCDVAGPPGVGKSTLCYPIWADKSVGWDGKMPPAHWRQFLDEITNLCTLVQDHPSMTAVVRMNNRSARKMATVARMEGDKTYVQNGFVQRILGFGWRLQDMGRDINLIRRALWLMPVSVGVAFLQADLETLLQRNKDREGVKATAHENRSYQVPLMLPSIQIAKDTLNERGVPILEVDTTLPVDQARQLLVEFAAQDPCHGAAFGSGCETSLLLSPPAWWQ